MSVSPTASDQTYFRRALGRFPTGVAIVCAQLPGQAPVGLTISSFNSVSLTPPLVLWSLSNTSSLLDVFLQCERYVIQILRADQPELAGRFAYGDMAGRFADLPADRAPGGTFMPAIDSAAWFECRNRSRYPEGDHLILVGEVEHCGHNESLPLVYHAGGFDLTPAIPAATSER
ncbi:flavin reductase family protein [Corticimicrobacter populi]|uniref:Flavin reductase n=1 Tax=Corticimicrobacter populi TaxID=2175229 RepID=A0A2V1K5K9_9BURK|nr:flavin reductase family protein [Corticimicrobacter populi]PWF24735.1 flavin reductase [Corticimicrobacter populi]QDQ86745.1 flavin reductase family protein [Alcaligenaceae bacterium SJ-26]